MINTECPTCGDEFSSEKGMKIHHQKSHGTSVNPSVFCDHCGRGFDNKTKLASHYNKFPEHNKTGTLCENCGIRFNRITYHWNKNDSCRPSLSQKQRQIITGILMGDGSIIRDKNPYMKIEMVSKNYLEYVSRELGVLTRGGIEEYNDSNETYHLVLRNNKDLQEFANWYDTGKKVWPSDIELTPTVLKHWYVCDGSKNKGSVGSPRIIIYMSNEHKNTDKVDNYFESQCLPKPSTYVKRERESGISCSAQFTVEDSEKLWDYMGGPLPDFEYKWPSKRLK
jgi:hypothetical protein